MSRVRWKDGHPEPEWIGALHDGELTADERVPVDGHISGCRECRAQLAALESLSELAPELDPILPGPEFWGGLEERILDRVYADTAAPAERQPGVILPAGTAPEARAETSTPSPRPATPAWRWLVPMAAVFGVVLLSWRLLTSSPSLVGQISSPGHEPTRGSPPAAGAPLSRPVDAARPVDVPATREAAQPLHGAPPAGGAAGAAMNAAEGVTPGTRPGPARSEKKLEASRQVEAPARDDERVPSAEPEVAAESDAAATADAALKPGAAAPTRSLAGGTQAVTPAPVGAFLAKAAPEESLLAGADLVGAGIAPVTGDLDSLLADDARRLAAGFPPDSLLAAADARAEDLWMLARDNPSDQRLVHRALVAARAREAWMTRLQPKVRDRANEERIAGLLSLLKKQ